MALAVVERAADERNAAVLVEGDLGELLVRRRGHLEIGADRDAAQLAVALALALALRKAGIVGKLQRVVHDAGEIAGVVHHARRRGYGIWPLLIRFFLRSW